MLNEIFLNTNHSQQFIDSKVFAYAKTLSLKISVKTESIHMGIRNILKATSCNALVNLLGYRKWLNYETALTPVQCIGILHKEPNGQLRQHYSQKTPAYFHTIHWRPEFLYSNLVKIAESWDQSFRKDNVSTTYGGFSILLLNIVIVRYIYIYIWMHLWLYVCVHVLKYSVQPLFLWFTGNPS